MKNVKKYLPSIFLIMVGLLLVVLGVFADSFGIGQGAKGSFGLSQWLMAAMGICMIILGLIGRRVILIVTVNLIVFLPLLLLVDNLLYLGSPWLPANVVRKMSRNAQTKYELAHWQDVPFAHDGDIWFFKPNSKGRKVTEKGTEKEIVYDALGYRNPPGYIDQSNGMDVVLLGDSFTEGSSFTTMADYLRGFLAPLNVYSLGIGGQGIPHWRLHFRRYMNSQYFKYFPKVVVLNFYSGNDIEDAVKYKPGIPASVGNSSKPQPPEQRFSLFGEIIGIMRYVFFYQIVPSVPEMEPLFEPKELVQAFAALSEVVNVIREKNPETIILLSYIATPGAIYGPDIEHCSDVTKRIFPKFDYSYVCKAGKAYVTRQADTSEILHKWADQLNIHYLDTTPILRGHAQKEILHLFNDPHFNDEANRIYSQMLAKAITDIVEAEKVVLGL